MIYETAGEEYYKNFYPDYAAQNPPRKIRFYRRLIEENLGSASGYRIADVGCAFGNVLGSMPARFDRHGFDVNAYAIQMAKQRYPDVSFSVTTGFEIPGGDSYDVISAFDVLEHLADPGNALSRIYSRLGNGGIFVFVVPVYDGPLGPIVHLLDKDTTHVNKWPRRRWLSITEQTFEIVSITGIFRVLLPLRRYYVHLPSRLMKNVSPAIAIVAKKG